MSRRNRTQRLWRHQVGQATSNLSPSLRDLQGGYSYQGDDVVPDTVLAGARARGVIHARQLTARRRQIQEFTVLVSMPLCPVELEGR